MATAPAGNLIVMSHWHRVKARRSLVCSRKCLSWKSKDCGGGRERESKREKRSSQVPFFVSVFFSFFLSFLDILCVHSAHCIPTALGIRLISNLFSLPPLPDFEQQCLIFQVHTHSITCNGGATALSLHHFSKSRYSLHSQPRWQQYSFQAINSTLSSPPSRRL